MALLRFGQYGTLCDVGDTIHVLITSKMFTVKMHGGGLGGKMVYNFGYDKISFTNSNWGSWHLPVNCNNAPLKTIGTDAMWQVAIRVIVGAFKAGLGRNCSGKAA